jgi:cell division protease FtsH
MKGLTELAELLLEKEVIFSEDLERIFGKRQAEILKDAREAEAKALLPASKEESKGAKKDKKSAKTSSEKTKVKLAKKESLSEIVITEKPVKKSNGKK